MSEGRWEARASMYLPFAALEGYDELVRAAMAGGGEPRRELADDDRARLSAEVSALSRGDLAEVEWHDGRRYVTEARAVRQVDRDLRVLRLEGLDVPFDSLWAARKAEE